MRAALDACGRIDGLVNNAGIQPVVHFTEMSDDEWTEMIDTNLTAVHRLTAAAAEAMRAQGTGGSIVHIASIEGRQPTDFHGHYATTKAGLLMHARAAAGAYGPHGVRVNSVSPGLIDRPGLAADWPEGVADGTQPRPWAGSARPRRSATPACSFAPTWPAGSPAQTW